MDTVGRVRGRELSPVAADMITTKPTGRMTQHQKTVLLTVHGDYLLIDRIEIPKPGQAGTTERSGASEKRATSRTCTGRVLRVGELPARTMRRQRSVSALLRAVGPRLTVGGGAPLAGATSRAWRPAARAAAAQAQAAATTSSSDASHGGTVYPVPSSGVTKYSNVDGGRVDDGRYTAFKADITKALIPEERVYTDPVKTFAYGEANDREKKLNLLSPCAFSLLPAPIEEESVACASRENASPFLLGG